MRVFARAVMIWVLGVGTMAAGAAPAAANGGAYFEIAKTYQVQGSTAVGRFEVSIPERRLGLLDRGPFTIYVTPARSRGIEAGRPIPADAVAVGTATVTERRGIVNVEARFVVPAVTTGPYSLELCNTPCTVDGFGEPLSGFLTIVETPVEARLLARLDREQRDATRIERDLRTAEEELVQSRAATTSANARVQGLLDERRELAIRVESLTSAPEPQPVVDQPVAVAAAVAIGLGIGLLIGGARRRTRDATDDDRPDRSAGERRATEPAGVG
jgi:hypothetical protein